MLALVLLVFLTNCDFLIGFNIARGFGGDLQSNQTTSNQGFKCYSCESPCENDLEYEHHCQNSIQCWKSTTRNALGEENVSRGCITSYHLINFYCRQNDANKKVDCCKGDYCNDGEFPELPPFNEFVILGITSTEIKRALKILVFVLIAAIGLVFALKRLWSVLLRKLPAKFLRPKGDFMETDHIDDEISSGGGAIMLKQRTLSKQVTLVDRIGRGRYGEVWRGIWNEENVAVKIFYSEDEESWKRETEIYTTNMLRHENILGFIGSDIHIMDSQQQFWLLTTYFAQGSLYDYLLIKELSVSEMMIMCMSIANGILHLHSEIGTNEFESKPSIAHRDLKSKNILVKNNGACVIADFGLAVTHSQVTGKIDIGTNPKVGTKRYMAPEVLDESINMNDFDALRRTDIYSFALVMWEICTGTVSNGSSEFKIPYNDVVPNDPSFEHMKKIVCEDNYRPEEYENWHTEPIILAVCRIMKECWQEQPSARLSILRIKKALQKIIASADDKTIMTHEEISV